MIAAYERLRKETFCVREEPMAVRASELELQAEFYRGDFGIEWIGSEGERIEMLHAGRWNREPGPDFCGARLRIDGREVDGDIEIDIHERDWEAHGHAENEAFSNVILHGCFHRGAKRFFTRTVDHRSVPQVCFPAAQPGKNAAQSGPHAPLEEKTARALIEAGCTYRLHRKRQAFQFAARLAGPDDALLQGLAVGLGYKNNKIPFLLVAQRTGLSRARSVDGEALLFGLAGFLQAKDFDRADDEEKKYLSTLWDDWWRLRDREARLILPTDAWKFAALRPANHPHRRMGALVALVREFSRLRKALVQQDDAAFIRILTEASHPYWNSRWNLSSSRLAGHTALVGSDRAQELLINTFVPALDEFETGQRLLANIPASSPSGKVRQAATWLVGSLRGLSSARDHQGLIQLYDDFFPVAPSVVADKFRGSLLS
jgi:Protein of unknown function (DUF2851)